LKHFGHSWAEIQEMSVDQMRLWLREGYAIQKREWREAVIGNRIAQHAEGDDFKRAMEE